LQLRDEIDHLISIGDNVAASARLAEFWHSDGGAAIASFVTSRYEKLRGVRNLSSHRVALLRSFTLEPVVPLLRAAAFVAGLDLAVRLGEFNAYAQEILDTDSSLYEFAPETVILAVQTRDIAPELWSGYADLEPDSVEASITRVTDSFLSWIKAFRNHSSANLLIHTLEQPAIPSNGILDAQADLGQFTTLRRINENLQRACRQYRGVYLVDYASLTARHGYHSWRDERKWLTARMPINAGHLIHLAQEWLRFLVPLTGRGAKVLAVDLDNTLWGGVIGEDGMNGIRLGPEYPGAAYQAVQRALLDLHRRGILLAVCSKNNPEDAMEALSRHPGMLLKPEHFACMRINWSDKTQNLREIAAELNIGIDAVAFLDDNPVERSQVRSALPEVAVIEFPIDPTSYADAIRDSPYFERLVISDEDRQRTALYAAQRERTRAEQNFTSKEDFFRSLEQEAEIASLEPVTLARIAQLTQKTNQFNLTTRRYSEQQITEIAGRSGCQVVSLRVRDRFGDHGLVGVAITKDTDDSRVIDTFLLSCRVIGRTVETALLFHLAETARSKGLRRLQGWFLPTRKNAPAKDFYAQHGFTLDSSNGEGSMWVLDLQNCRLECPAWVKLHVLAGEKN
jgi:FkbH-like protein